MIQWAGQDSKILISTRSGTIAGGFNTVEYKPLTEKKSRIMLLYNVDADMEQYNDETVQNLSSILHACGGLPLALSIANRYIHIEYAKSLPDDMGDENGANISLSSTVKANAAQDSIKLYHNRIRQLPRENHERYGELRNIIETSLQHLDGWNSQAIRESYFETNNVSISNLVKSFCVLGRQNFINLETLSKMWNTNKEFTKRVIEKLNDFNIVTGISSITMHDLVLKIVNYRTPTVEKMVWHQKLLNTYNKDDCLEWWEIQDDGYIDRNLARHLSTSMNEEKLIHILTDFRWVSKRKYSKEGWLSLTSDWSYLSDEKRNEMKNILDILRKTWFMIPKQYFPFKYFGLISKEERKKSYMKKFLYSVLENFPKPFLVPQDKCIWPRDSRETQIIPFSHRVRAISACWKNNTVAVALHDTIELWNIKTNEHMENVFGNSGTVTCVAFSEDGKLLVSGYSDGTLRRWDADSGLMIGEIMKGHLQSVEDVSINSNGSWIVSGSCDTTLVRWNARTGLQEGNPLSRHNKTVNCIAISKQPEWIASGSDDETICLWDLNSGEMKCNSMTGHYSRVTSLSISSDGRSIISGSEDANICFWTVNSEGILEKTIRVHKGCISSISISQNELWMVSASNDNTIIYWDLNKKEPTAREIEGHTDWVTSVAVNEDGSRIISGSNDQTVRQWNPRNSFFIREHTQGHNQEVTCLEFSPDGTFVVSGSKDGTLLVWDVDTGFCTSGIMEGHDCMIHRIAISKDKRIFSISANSIEIKWNADGKKIGEPEPGPTQSAEAWFKPIEKREKLSDVPPNDMTCYDIYRKSNFESPKVALGLKCGRVVFCTLAEE